MSTGEVSILKIPGDCGILRARTIPRWRRHDDIRDARRRFSRFPDRLPWEERIIRSVANLTPTGADRWLSITHADRRDAY
jgi:hypothetical protein